MQELPDKSVDLILCDLPYGTTDCKWDIIIPFDELWSCYYRVIKDNGAIVLFSAQPFTTQLIYSNLKHFRYCWYWLKNSPTGFCFAKYQPMRKVEDICVFYKKMPTYNPQGLIKIENPKAKQKRVSDRDTVYKMATLANSYTPKFKNYPKNVLGFAKDTVRLHPTQKPVDLLEYLIKTYTNENDLVLDNCMGSGSTGIACLNTNRQFIGMELKEDYFNIAKQRINDAKKAVNQ